MLAALAGGVGAARFLRGLVQVVPPDDITVIVNTGDDDWFHLAPGGSRTTRVRPLPAAGPLRGVVQALNAESSTPIVVAP